MIQNKLIEHGVIFHDFMGVATEQDNSFETLGRGEVSEKPIIQEVKGVSPPLSLPGVLEEQLPDGIFIRMGDNGHFLKISLQAFF